MILISLLRRTTSAASKQFVRTSGLYAAAAQMLSSRQNLSLLFLNDSIHGKWILRWTVRKEEGSWDFELCLAKEQENWLPSAFNFKHNAARENRIQ